APPDRPASTSRRSSNAASSTPPSARPTHQLAPSFTTTCAAPRTSTRRRHVITEETIQKLNDMRLHTMAKVLREILATAPGHALSFEEKVGMLVDREWTDRDNRRLSRRLKEAKLGTGRAILEDVTVDPARGLEKSLIRELATCGWARAKQNVVIIGATG